MACLGAEYMEEGITSRWCLRRSAPNHTGNVERQVNMESTPHMVVVATVSQPFEATPIQMKLGSFGIESELNGEMTVAANPFLARQGTGLPSIPVVESLVPSPCSRSARGCHCGGPCDPESRHEMNANNRLAVTR